MLERLDTNYCLTSLRFFFFKSIQDTAVRNKLVSKTKKKNLAILETALLLKFSTTERVVFVNSLASGGNYGSLNLEGSTVEIRGGVKQSLFTKTNSRTSR